MVVLDGGRGGKRVTASSFALLKPETSYLLGVSAQTNFPKITAHPSSLQLQWYHFGPQMRKHAFQLSRSLTWSVVPILSLESSSDQPGVLGMDPASTSPSRTVALLRFMEAGLVPSGDSFFSFRSTSFQSYRAPKWEAGQALGIIWMIVFKYLDIRYVHLWLYSCPGCRKC